MGRSVTPKLCRNSDGRAFATVPRSGRRRIYFGQYGTPEAEAAYRKWLGQILRADDFPQQAASIPVVTSTTTLADLMGPYLDHAAEHYEGPEFRNMRDALQHLWRYHGDDLAASFGPVALRSFRDALSRDGWRTRPKTGQGQRRQYSRRHINATVNRVRRFLRWCESQELVPSGTSARLATVEPLRSGSSKLTVERPPVEAVSWLVVRSTLQWCREDLAMLILVQFLCGMRPSEACRMTTEQIDRSGEVWLYKPRRHKTSHRGQELVKIIPAPARRILEARIQAAASPTAPLFVTRFGRRYTATTYGKAILQAVKASRWAGVALPPWRPNQLRHLVAQRIDESLGREDAQHFLGHARPDTTAIYAKQNRAALLRAALMMEQILYKDVG